LSGFIIFRIVFFALFFGLHCALIGGVIFEWRRDRKAGGGSALKKAPAGGGGSATADPAEGLPKVSVIIPVRNEERRIDGLLQTLAVQDYPAAEFIFVDDRSSDESPRKLTRFVRDMAGRSGAGRRIITLRENPGPNHKQYALGRGIEAASGELFLFTDADCEVPPHWISAMVRRMGSERTGAVIGPVFKKTGGGSFFYFYQCLDHAVRYLYLAGATGLGAVGGGFGNNLILRRKSLDLIGGYESVPFSPTEDAALLSRIRSRSTYRVRSAVGADTFVFTDPEKTWGTFINQTLRWNNGGLFSPDLLTRINFSYLMISISSGILAVPLLPFFPGLWPISFTVVLSSLVMNTATVCLFWPSLPKCGGLTVPRHLFQCVFIPTWMTFLTLLGFFRVKTNWKGSPMGLPRAGVKLDPQKFG
jgi:cellulose synthase/poly-beta-1,6-N-acetylglucosamine synthase-like glycosyltransferase